MDTFIKAIAGILITLVMGQVLWKQGQNISLLLTLFVCTTVMLVAVNYLKPVLDFLEHLRSAGSLDSELFKILLKVVGIGLLTELTSLICADAGNAALGKTLQLLASAIILWMSIPLLRQLLELIETVLGEV